MLALVISHVGIGLVAGVVAPFLVPGRRNMPMVVTIVLGVLGSFVGGFLGYLLLGRDTGQPGWVIGSIIGAVIALVLFTAFGRLPTEPGRPDSRRGRLGSTASTRARPDRD